ncbi:WD domain protein [Sporothrix schenckii 1099-18]|uniref:WD domain protein n=1 Tax=Sporothrix schenckii 1099-18 TaxID=1397361 RepID=A0A0F2LW63_SPOSC|nr:WD domain protein [Sporothrix schenckii 1099-18]KJR81069.1 WD domain protein [Sporothrix schenckii 1099-18]
MYHLAVADEYQFPGSTPPYVLDLIPLASGLASISTDGKLSLFDPARIGAGPKRSFATSHGNLTTARAFDTAGCVLATAGGNGTVALWDLRDAAQGPQASAKVGSADANVMSLACDLSTQSVAVGTELVDYQASIVMWDIRAGPTPKVRYTDVHSDDVTELNFHPTNGHILLSGSTDGLVNVCDTRIADEDEVVIQAFNHGASIHHAGFLNDTEVYALSHDEKLALYDLAEAREAGSATRDFGDVRQILDCQYVANVLPKSGGQAGAVIGAGSQDLEMFQLVHLTKGDGWAFALDSVVGLPVAHGTEIVRGFCVFDEQQAVYTCGEDGKVRAWRPSA